MRLVVSVTCHLGICETEFCVLESAIWWQSVELEYLVHDI
jgi:hypothetical protein